MAYSISQLDKKINDYNAQRAYGILLTNGPEAVANLGLERYLPNSPLETFLVALGAYTASRTRVAEHMYEAVQRLLHDKQPSRRKFLFRLGLAALLGSTYGCGGGSPNGGTAISGIIDPTPVGKGNISGTVTTLDKKLVNGLIDFMDSQGTRIYGTADVNNGNYRLEGIENIGNIGRIRVRGAQNSNLVSLISEFNAGRVFGPGDNVGVDYIVLDRKQGLAENFQAPLGVTISDPSFYDIVNRNPPIKDSATGQKTPGSKKVTQPLNFYADMRTMPGGSRQSPDTRIGLTQKALDYTYREITGWPAPTIIKSTSPPEVGNGNVIIKYNDGPFGDGHLNGHRIDGGTIALPSFSLVGYSSDIIESAAVLFFLGESDEIRPSIANNNINATLPAGTNPTLKEVDYNMLTAAKFQTLGNTKKQSFDGIAVESWEIPVR